MLKTKEKERVETKVCSLRRYELLGMQVICVRCENPTEENLMTQPFHRNAFEATGLTVRVTEPLCGEVFEFQVSVEDDGILLSTGYDSDCDIRGCDPDQRDDDAWAAMDAALGFDVREVALDKGIGADWPPLSGLGAVSFALVPYEYAILIRNGLKGR